jgi:GTP-binding protein
VTGPLRLHFLQSAAEVAQMPGSRAELAVLGRSNVGKSSLINALAHRKSLAKTSKAPGATRLLNIYEMEPEDSGQWLVDLPGYGYAKAAKHEQNRWARMIEDYLTERDQLVGGILLIDGAIGPTELDLQTIEWLRHIELPYRFVATKCDKVKPSKRGARRKELTSKLDVDPDDILWVSATAGTGVPELRAEIAAVLDEAATL